MELSWNINSPIELPPSPSALRLEDKGKEMRRQAQNGDPKEKEVGADTHAQFPVDSGGLHIATEILQNEELTATAQSVPDLSSGQGPTPNPLSYSDACTLLDLNSPDWSFLNEEATLNSTSDSLTCK
jgi:hypothetical protein